MLALAYDAALRREEQCLLRTDDLDPAFRSLRVRAETTKNRRERITPYSAATGELLRTYLDERRTISRSRGPLFLSVSRRNRAATTLQYIHLSGRDLPNKLAHGMAEVHAWRVNQLSELPGEGTTC